MIKRYTIFSAALILLLGSASFVIAATADSPKAVTPDNLKASNSFDEVALEGTVLETMNSGGYTYLQIDSQMGKIWVAIPETKVTKGEKVSSAPGMMMQQFQSKTLNRSFDRIIFSPGLGAVMSTKPEDQGKKTTPIRQGHSFADALKAEEGQGMGSDKVGGDMVMGNDTSGGSAGAAVPAVEVNVNKASGENGYSIGEIFTKAEELNGKKVRICGKVMKNSRMIMGKNWLHIQDGTGDPVKNQHDLVATTTEDPGENTIVTIEGVLTANRDFGAGYKYEAIVENAKVENK